MADPLPTTNGSGGQYPGPFTRAVARTARVKGLLGYEARGQSSLVRTYVRTYIQPRPLYARGARCERDKGLVPVVRACVEFYWNPGKIVFFGIILF